MLIEKEDLYKRFYDKIKDDYPKLTYLQIRSICYSPFSFVTMKMKEIFISFKFRYIGTFTITAGRARNLKKKTDQNLAAGTITQEQAIKYHSILDYVIETNKVKKELRNGKQ